MASTDLNLPESNAPGLNAPDVSYRDGQMHVEAVSVARIAASVGTPFYCYSAATLRRNYRALALALSQLPATICYALKANSNLAVIKVFAREGAGADVVSEGELRRALAADVPADKIVFSGVGKTEAEMAFALSSGIMQINIESEPELEVLNKVAGRLGRVARISVRVNPDVDARTHEKISTGRKQDKFGVAYDRVAEVAARSQELEHVDLVGVAVHIGSQLTSLTPFRSAFEKVAQLVRELRASGHNIRKVDLGGGLGITYDTETTIGFTDYANMIGQIFGDLDVDLVFEPGRSMVGNAGILVTKTLYVKEAGERPIVVVDAAMNDLKRPAMYGAFHGIAPVRAPSGVSAEAAPLDGSTLAETQTQEVDVVGPICESGDTFATRRRLPPLAEGDLVAFGSAGAYGAVMSSSYNSRLLIPEVLVDDDRFAVVRARPTYEEMLSMDSLPDWLNQDAATADQVTMSRGAA